jgi:hypothetical protein
VLALTLRRDRASDLERMHRTGEDRALPCDGAAVASGHPAAGSMMDWSQRLLDRRGSHAVGTGPSGITARGVLGELLLLVFALGAYYGVRLLVRDSGSETLGNAATLLRFESLLNLDWEVAVQQAFLDHLHPVVHLLNFVYAWGYWLVLFGSLGYLYVRHRDVYRGLRNAMIISGLIGLVIFASFPVAPPRLTTMGVIDTVRIGDSALEEVVRPSGLTNQNAAMPSFHFGWILLCGVCLSLALKRRVSKTLVLALPLVMGLTIMVTGNHYTVDAIVGGALALFSLTPWILQRRRIEKEPYELQRV